MLVNLPQHTTFWKDWSMRKQVSTHATFSTHGTIDVHYTFTSMFGMLLLVVNDSQYIITCMYMFLFPVTGGNLNEC